jgi:hypothetical protein
MRSEVVTQIWYFLGYDAMLSAEHSACHYILVCLLTLLFDPEDGGNMFLRNFGKFPTTLHGVVSHKALTHGLFNWKNSECPRMNNFEQGTGQDVEVTTRGMI